MELLTTLGINWQLLTTQLLNFGILIVVLTYLVYKPLLRIIDERAERVRKSMDDVKHIESQKKEIDAFKTQQMKKIDAEMGQYLEAAKKQAEDVKRDILAQAQKEADQLLQKTKEQVASERTRMVADMQTTLANVVVQLSAKVIQREFNEKDQERLMGDLSKNIPALLQ